MVYTSTLTSKNQTTIPKAVVAALHAQPSATLCFEMEPDGRVILTAKAATFAQLADSFPKKGRTKPATLNDMTAAIRAGAARASTSKRTKASQG
jgi:bifunctional DNA-binding transcriptional regulator/antitoxin component of YhaV-PrlF toxin-antitoxin module